MVYVGVYLQVVGSVFYVFYVGQFGQCCFDQCKGWVGIYWQFDLLVLLVGQGGVVQVFGYQLYLVDVGDVVVQSGYYQEYCQQFEYLVRVVVYVVEDVILDEVGYDDCGGLG